MKHWIRNRISTGIIAGLMMTGCIPCVADAPPRAGDVVGRDLDLPGLEWLGHVGIYGGSRVLECLDASDPIQKNPLRSFVTATNYWGARYLPGSHRFRRVIAKGWAQRNFKPSYTLSSVYQRGRYVNKRVWNATSKSWERRTVLVPAKFRCDTLVYYAFKSGIGYKLAGESITPTIVFRNCPKER